MLPGFSAALVVSIGAGRVQSDGFIMM